MKWLFLLSVCAFNVNVGFGQKCVVSAVRENILYLGLPNPIDIAVEGRSCKTFTVTASNGKIEPGLESCSYQITPDSIGISEICIYTKGLKKVLLGKTKFRVRMIPAPVAEVGGLHRGEIHRKILAVQLGVRASIKGMDIDARFVVTSFTMIILRDEKSIYSEKTNENRFTENTSSALRSLKANDKVVICNISCRGPDSVSRSIEAVELTVTD